MTAASAPTPEIDLRSVPIAEVFESPFNTRTHFDADKMRDLEASIREVGVLTPLIVRPVGERYELAAGHRRLRAAQAAGVETVPVSVRALTDLQLREVITIENLQREDIHPLDEARGYQALLAAAKKTHTVASVAARVGKSESYVYRRLKLLELEADLLTALGEDRLSLAHAEKLMRLTPALRKEAVDEGAVWRNGSLLDDADDDRPGPTSADLQPLYELERFIRTRHHFDPTSRDTKHFQEQLAEQIDEARIAGAGDEGQPETFEQVASTLVELSIDPMARMKLRAGPNDKIPLTPSKWREVKTEKDRCPHVVRGVISHGGEARILEVCTKKSCTKHFPVAKKKPASKKATSAGTPKESAWDAQERRRREAEARWKSILPAARAAFVAHLSTQKLDLLAVIKETLDSWNIRNVKDEFGVELTRDTVLQVLVLADISDHSAEHFSSSTKTWGFDYKAFEKKHQAEVAAKGAAALKDQQQQLSGKKGAKPAAKKSAKKKGGRK